MATSFVLIYWLIATSSNFAATGSVVFNDEDSCEAARKAVIAQWSGPAGADAVCVAQGEKIAPIVTPPSVTVPTLPITITAPPAPTPQILAVAPRHFP